MKKAIILFALPAALLFAADDKGKTQTQETKTKTVAPSGLPAGAVQSSPFTWRYTDAKGAKWIYRQTPFGLVKLEDKADDAPAVESKVPTTVTDLGESYKFERNTPFGKQSWTRKKSELNDEEQAFVKKSQEKQ